MAQDNSYYIKKISESAVEAKYEDIDGAMIRNAKNRILDLLGCALVGAKGPGSEGMANLVKSWGGKEESTVFVFGGKVPALNAAMANSAITRTYDFEAIGAFVEGVDLASHVSVTTVLTALAMAEAHGANGKELLASLLVGDDVASRLLSASFDADGKNFDKGWDGNGTANAFGATAIAGRMLGLTKEQMQHAFGIVMNQLGGSFQNIWDASLCFKLPNALSARNGIFSAELAKAGWDGPQDAYFSKFGYFGLFTDGCANADILTKDIGKTFYAEATIKPYSCCRANHGAIDCAVNMVAENNFEAEAIDEIILRASPGLRNGFVGQEFKLRVTPQVDAAFSVRFNVANVLLRKSSRVEHFQEERIREPGIARLANMVRFEDLAPDEIGKFSVALTVKLKDGSVFNSGIKFVRGGPFENSFTDDDIKNKFRNNLLATKVISVDSGEKIIELVDNLEKMDSIDELAKLMV